MLGKTVIVLLCSLLSVFLFLTPISSVYAQYYSCATPTGGSYTPKIITRENSRDIYVIWTYYYGCGEYVLLFAKSADNGNTFGKPIEISHYDYRSTAGNEDSQPIVAASPGTSDMYVAWTRYVSSSMMLYFKKTTDNAPTLLGNTVKVDTNGTDQPTVHDVVVASHSMNNNNSVNSNRTSDIGIIWSAYFLKSGTHGIFLSESIDGGNTFGKPVLISNGTGDSSFNSAIQVGNKAYVLWYSLDQCSSNGNQLTLTCPNGTYIATISISNNSSADGSQFSISRPTFVGDIGSAPGFPVYTKPGSSPPPHGSLGSVMAISGNNVYVAGTIINGSSWKSGSSISIHLVKSSDSALTFGKPISLASYNNYTSLNKVNSLSVDASKNFVYVGWYKYNYQSANIDVITSSDFGNIFGNIQKVNIRNGSVTSEPVVTAASGVDYFLTWQQLQNETSGHETLLFAKSTDGGRTFDKSIDLTGDAGASVGQQAMLTNNDYLYIVWLNPAFTDGRHVMFTKSVNEGNTFSNPIDLDKNSFALADAAAVPEFNASLVELLLVVAVGAIIGVSVIDSRMKFFHR
jgi:hypothetical protein